MTYQERKGIFDIIITLILGVIFSIILINIISNGNNEVLNDYVFWGRAVLLYIAAGIVVSIITTILFSIVNTILTKEGEPEIRDERDKLIELKTSRIALIIFGFGFILSFASMALAFQPFVMLVVLLVTGILSSLASDIAKIFYYRRGY